MAFEGLDLPDEFFDPVRFEGLEELAITDCKISGPPLFVPAEKSIQGLLRALARSGATITKLSLCSLPIVTIATFRVRLLEGPVPRTLEIQACPRHSTRIESASSLPRLTVNLKSNYDVNISKLFPQLCNKYFASLADLGELTCSELTCSRFQASLPSPR